ncbi:MAG: Hpt domain-containing protein [Pikeienuella sp.]
MLNWGRKDPGGKAPPILDYGYLDRLERHIGRETLAELIADGMIEIADRLADLEEKSAAGDRRGILRIGHDLAGLAGHLGLSALSVAAAEMNRAARAEPQAAAARLAAPVVAAGRTAEGALRAALKARG